MSEYPPHVHALLEAARRDHDPSPADEARVRAALLASLGAAQVTLPAATAQAQAGAATHTSIAAGSAVGKLSLAGKAFLVSAFVGGTTLGGYAWLREPPRTADAAHQARALSGAQEAVDAREPTAEGSEVGALLGPLHGGPAPLAAAEPRAGDSARAARADAPSSQPAMDTVPSLATDATPQRARWADSAAGAGRRANRLRGAQPTHSTTPRQATTGAERTQTSSADQTSRAPAEAAFAQPLAQPAQTATEEPAGREPSLLSGGAEAQDPSRQAELALIRETLTSLRDHAPQRALRLLEEHESRFPQGVFAHERRGLRAVALCEAGESARGKRERARFLRQDSHSPLAARVRKACEEE